MLPVGQGDCVVMQCPNGHLVMYDCGSIDAQKAFTTEELKFAILKYVKAVTIFISHGDLDHYKYLPNLFPADGLVKIFIDYVIIGGDLEDYTQIQGWMHSVASKGKLYKINDGEECIGDCSDMLDRVPYHQTWTHQRTTLGDMNICRRQDINFDIIAANVRSPKNQKSIVLKATAGGRSMLLSGDIEGKAAEAVAKDVPDQLKSDVYQISHHGACDKANKCPWLEAIHLEEAFVSHAYAGQHSHPRCVAILKLLKLKSIATGHELSPLTHPLIYVRQNKD